MTMTTTTINTHNINKQQKQRHHHVRFSVRLYSALCGQYKINKYSGDVCECVCGNIVPILHNKWKPSRLHAINWDSARKRAQNEALAKSATFFHCVYVCCVCYIHPSIKRAWCLVNFFLTCTLIFFRWSIIYSIWITKIPKLESVNQCGRFQCLYVKPKEIHSHKIFFQIHLFSLSLNTVLCCKMRV